MIWCDFEKNIKKERYIFAKIGLTIIMLINQSGQSMIPVNLKKRITLVFLL